MVTDLLLCLPQREADYVPSLWIYWVWVCWTHENVTGVMPGDFWGCIIKGHTALSGSLGLLPPSLSWNRTPLWAARALTPGMMWVEKPPNHSASDHWMTPGVWIVPAKVPQVMEQRQVISTGLCLQFLHHEPNKVAVVFNTVWVVGLVAKAPEAVSMGLCPSQREATLWSFSQIFKRIQEKKKD